MRGAGCPILTAFNLTKNPSCSIPCGFSDGLPIGLMVTDPLYEDLGVLPACRAYGEAAGPVWPSPELRRCLDKIARPADTAVKARYRRAGAYEGGSDGEQGAEAEDP